MSVKSAPFYWLICDSCGVRSTLNADHFAWMDVPQAIEDAEDSDWVIKGDAHWCVDCVRWCEECESDLVAVGLSCTECGWVRK